MRIQYFAGTVQQRRTGGQIYLAELMRFHAEENEVIHEVGVAEADLGSIVSANRWSWRQMRRARSDIIVEDSFFAPCLFISNRLVEGWRPSIVALVQEFPETYTHWPRGQQVLRWVIMSLFLRSAHLVVVNSDYTCRQLLSHYPVSPQKVIVISPAGQKLKREDLSPTRATLPTNKLLCVGSIQFKKGQKHLIQAMQLLNGRDCCLTLVGGVKEPDYYREISTLLSEYRLRDRVRLTGFLKEDALAAEYVAADVFVYPCLDEEYGMVVAEALGYGLPVVASRVGGIPEIVGADGSIAFLVPPRDPPALARALCRLLDDPQLRARMGQAALGRATELPTWDEVCQRFHCSLMKLRR